MIYNQFYNLSCYEEFEIKCALMGISKINVLKIICHKIDNYYFFVSNDGIFNWFDLKGNHIEDPGILKELKCEHIPKTITKCIIPNSVTSIGDCTFWNCKSLKEVIIPDSVINIGEYTFYSCTSLKEITLPNDVTNIGRGIFSECVSLKEITIPNSVTSIGYEAFENCTSLTSITIPDSVNSIGSYAFLYCKSLEEIIIPNDITYIGYNAFSNCKSLKQIIFKGKTLKQVKRMMYYPFGIEDENVFKFS